MRWLVLGLAACGAPNSSPSGDLEPQDAVEVRIMLDGPARAGGGNLIVQVEYDPLGQIEVPEPAAVGLEFAGNGQPTLENLGGREVVTQRYIYKGSKGNYEIIPLTVKWTGEDGAVVEAQSTPVFLDIEKEFATAGELADIAEPAEIWRIPWLPIVGVGALLVGGLGFAFWPRRREEEVEEEAVPPHIAALEKWDAVRRNPALSDEDKARELSVIFREYTEGVFHFEASAWTTSEILEHLRGMHALSKGNVPRAKRLLRATDRIKFAEERPSGELIEELDADLRAFVESTQPRSWGPES